MTDKQIIIDGVDVSECEYYNKDDKTCREVNGNYDTDICEFDKCENSNCYYKQLKRKEQELQEAMDNYVQLDLQRVKEYNELVDLYKAKEQECERLKKKLKPKLKNAHCVYFDGQTGWCKAKEFIRCNPIGCKLYTIDELSTIVDLQQQLDQLKAENDELKNFHIKLVGVKECDIRELLKLKQALTEIEEIAMCIMDDDLEESSAYYDAKQILQKIRECEVER